MICRVLALYRHLLRRSPAPDEHPLDHKVTQIRVPLTEPEYIEMFGVDWQGNDVVREGDA